MATQAQIDRLIGRALFDPMFRELLLANPEKAARSLRYRLTESQAARIRELNAQDLEKLAAEFARITERKGIGFW